MAKGEVLVTGAGGFIGSHLTEALLAEGRAVRALDLNLDRIQHLASTPDLQTLTADIRDEVAVEQALAGVGTVFHLAAAHLGASTPEIEFRQVNIDATKNLVSTASRAGARRFVHCSSVGVFGRIDNPPADETTICRPELTYEKTKLLASCLGLRSRLWPHREVVQSDPQGSVRGCRSRADSASLCLHPRHDRRLSARRDLPCSLGRSHDRR
jgi:nucleoside-diphosphate-sugar epimerase